MRARKTWKAWLESWGADNERPAPQRRKSFIRRARFATCSDYDPFLIPKIRGLRAKPVKRSKAVCALLRRSRGPVEDLPEPFREWIIDFGKDGYIVRYRFDNDTATILAVRHGKEAGV